MKSRLRAAGRRWRRVPVLSHIGTRRTAALIVTTNLPFSEWTTVFPNPRLCKALLDRVTDPAHIIETETGAFRFGRTMSVEKSYEQATVSAAQFAAPGSFPSETRRA